MGSNLIIQSRFLHRRASGLTHEHQSAYKESHPQSMHNIDNLGGYYNVPNALHLQNKYAILVNANNDPNSSDIMKIPGMEKREFLVGEPDIQRITPGDYCVAEFVINQKLPIKITSERFEQYQKALDMIAANEHENFAYTDQYRYFPDDQLENIRILIDAVVTYLAVSREIQTVTFINQDMLTCYLYRDELVKQMNALEADNSKREFDDLYTIKETQAEHHQSIEQIQVEKKSTKSIDVSERQQREFRLKKQGSSIA